MKEFESVELGDLSKKKPKIPRRTIYFASGETMEEYSTDEEEEEEPEKVKTISKVDPVSCIKSLNMSVIALAFLTSSTYSRFASLIIVKANLGSIRLVPNVESGNLNHLR